jgi:hypothetical protein
VFLGPDGGHCRRSNYARRVFRPACGDRYHPGTGQPARLVIADASAWPGVPWIPGHAPSQARPLTSRPEAGASRRSPRTPPLVCWLPVKQGLTPRGLRHSHRTWIAQDGVPEILAEQRLGHEVPSMRGLYAHASERMMRDDLKHALQARWEESLRPEPPSTPAHPSRCSTISGAVPRASSTTGHRRPADDTGRQAEDDLPDPSQPCRKPRPGK